MPYIDADLSSSLIVDRLYGSSSKEDPAHVLQFDELIEYVKFSPYLWSHDLILIAFSSRIIVGHLSFQEEIEGQEEPLRYDKIETYPCYDRVHAASWSSETNLKRAPRQLIFAVATSRFEIVIYSSNASDTLNQKVLNVHKNYVNDINYDPLNEYLASGSDDLTCRVWSVKDDYSQIHQFYFESPVMSVQFHKNDSGKLLVGEKYGAITLINVVRGHAILSLRSQGSILLGMDWAPSNAQYVSAIHASGHLIVWFLESPGSPCYNKVVHPEGGYLVQFSPLSEQILLTMGSPDFTLKLLSNKLYPKTIATMRTATGLSVHQHLPYVAVGLKRNIYLWKINNNNTNG